MSIVSGGTDLSVVTNALAQLFQDRVVPQYNRSFPLLMTLPHKNGFGKNVAWDVRLGDGQVSSSSSVLADGTDVSTYNKDTLLPATLSWGVYSEAFALSGLALAAAASTGNPMELANLMLEELQAAASRLASNIAKEFFIGTTSGGIVGLSAANGGLLATGTYAGIDKGAHTDFAGNELANGGTLRANSFTLMRDMRTKIYTRCGEMPDLIVCDPQRHENYGLLFGNNERLNKDVFIRGQKINLAGGYNALWLDGIPVIADVNCPANKMYFLNTNYVNAVQLPHNAGGAGAVFGDEANTATITLVGTAEEQMNSANSGIIARLNPLARQGDSFRTQLVAYVQAQVSRPQACGILEDLQ